MSLFFRSPAIWLKQDLRPKTGTTSSLQKIGRHGDEARLVFRRGRLG